MARLYRLVDGNDEKILHTGLIGSHNIVDSILLARRFKLTFESEADFDARFWAKLEAFESSPGADAGVTYSKESDRVVAAEVDSKREYLVALSERTWDDFDPD